MRGCAPSGCLTGGMRAHLGYLQACIWCGCRWVISASLPSCIPKGSRVSYGISRMCKPPPRALHAGNLLALIGDWCISCGYVQDDGRVYYRRWYTQWLPHWVYGWVTSRYAIVHRLSEFCVRSALTPSCISGCLIRIIPLRTFCRTVPEALPFQD